MYKELLQLNNTKANPNLKIGRKLNTNVYKQMKRCPTSLFTGEVQINNLVSLHMH